MLLIFTDTGVTAVWRRTIGQQDDWRAYNDLAGTAASAEAGSERTDESAVSARFRTEQIGQSSPVQ